MKEMLVSDVTLREMNEMGEHALTFRERANIAVTLERMGVDAIELPAMRRVKEETVMNRTICGTLRRAAVKIPVGSNAESLMAAWESIKDAVNPILQVIFPVSTVQMEYFCHCKAPAMIVKIGEMCRAASKVCKTVEFVAQDASRAEESVVLDACRAAQEAGATAITLCDDAGTWLPEDCAAAVGAVAATCTLPIFVRPSDTLRMATAVAVAAIRAGAAGIVTATAGDTCMPTEVLADVMRAKGEELGVSCHLQMTDIHRDAGTMRRETEADTARDSGTPRIRLTPDSTAADVTAAVELLGYDLTEQDKGQVYTEVQRVTAQKKHIGARELEAIIATSAMQVPSTYHLDSYVSSCGNVMSAMAQITLVQNGETYSGVSMGDGPIDAAFLAIEQIVGHHYELDDFQIQSVTEGRGAVGNALVKLRNDGKLYSGSGVSTDIIGASIRAYLNALNKIVSEEQ